MIVCKFIISFYDNGARKNLKITYNNKLPHYRDFYYRTSKQQNNKADLWTYTFYANGKLSYFLVILKKIIVTFIRLK